MKTNLLVAACAFAITQKPDQKYLVLIPDGEFKGVDGRPFDVPVWKLTPENGRAIVAELNSRKVDTVVDWEHGTLFAKEKGEPAPAAGWLKAGSFEYVPGVGICSTSWNWLAKAAAHIESEEYRYLSPLLTYHPTTGEVVGLLNAALTNMPCIDVLPEVLLAASQSFIVQQSKESIVDKELLAALGLPEDATKEQVLAKVAENKTAALSRQQQTEPDPSKYVPKTMYDALVAKNAELGNQAATQETDALITAALSDGRLLGEGAEAWARNFAQRDPAGLKAHLEAAPKIAALSQRQTTGQHQGGNDNPGRTQFDADTLSVAAQMGHDQAFLTKHGGNA